MINWIEIRGKYFNVLELSIRPPSNSIYIKFDILNNWDYYTYFNNLFQYQMKGDKMKNEIITPEFRVNNFFITNISEDFSISGNIMNVSFQYDYIDFESVDEQRDRIINYILNKN